jgi:hypothetical protein
MAGAICTGKMPISRSAIAGVIYFTLVFAVGFLLGLLRVLVLVPRWGDTTAVIAELPLMLLVSWRVCRWVIARYEVAPVLSARAVMGGLAFTLLMLAELAVAVLGLGRSLAEHAAQYREIAASVGLGGQILFAIFPLFQLTLRPFERFHAAMGPNRQRSGPTVSDRDA